MLGRPKVNGRKDPLESKKVGKLARKGGVVMTCSLCHGKVHNKQGCVKRNADLRSSGDADVRSSTHTNRTRLSGDANIDLSTYAKENNGKGKSKVVEDKEKGKSKAKEDNDDRQGKGKSKATEDNDDRQGKGKSKATENNDGI